MSIYNKLLAIQHRIIGLGKDKKGNNYDYVTGNKLLNEVKPMMNDLKLILKQEIISIDNERIDYRTGIGTQYEKPKSEILSKVMMRFTWVDCETGESDVNMFGANGQNDWDKGVGSALTYGERYFLLKYFHIATDEDDIDNPDRKKEEPQPQAPQPPKKEFKPATTELTTAQKESVYKLLSTSSLTIPERAKISESMNNEKWDSAKFEKCVEYLKTKQVQA